jgi:hypothetical protein
MFRMAIALVCLVSIGGIGCDDRDDGAATSDGGVAQEAPRWRARSPASAAS